MHHLVGMMKNMRTFPVQNLLGNIFDYCLIFSGAYKICFRNQQYFARKILYIGVLAVHIDRLMESTVKRIRGDVNVTAKIDEFSQRALVNISFDLFQKKIFRYFP